MLRRSFVSIFLLAALAFIPAMAGAQAGVYLSTEEALREIFPAAAHVAVWEWRPSAEQRASLETTLRRELHREEYDFLLAFGARRRFLGYALVTEERGKYRPITFMVGITPELTVKEVAVMVYRESRGGGVRHSRFLSQYEGKALRDPIRTHRDIINISGATISVRSMNTGVRKALALAGAAFGNSPPTVAAAELHPLSTLK